MVDFSKSLFIVDVLLQLLVLYVPEMGAHEVGKGAKLEGDDLSHLLSFLVLWCVYLSKWFCFLCCLIKNLSIVH